MDEDSKQKIGMAITFIKNMDNEEFREKIKNKEDLAGKYKSFLMFLPAQYKTLISNLDIESIKDILKEEVPDKYEIIEENDAWDFLNSQFKELKKAIG